MNNCCQAHRLISYDPDIRGDMAHIVILLIIEYSGPFP